MVGRRIHWASWSFAISRQVGYTGIGKWTWGRSKSLPAAHYGRSSRSGTNSLGGMEFHLHQTKCLRQLMEAFQDTVRRQSAAAWVAPSAFVLRKTYPWLQKLFVALLAQSTLFATVQIGSSLASIHAGLDSTVARSIGCALFAGDMYPRRHSCRRCVSGHTTPQTPLAFRDPCPKKGWVGIHILTQLNGYLVFAKHVAVKSGGRIVSHQPDQSRR